MPGGVVFASLLCMPFSSVSVAVEDAKQEVAPWIERLARVGFGAKALLYMTVGALAASAALGLGGKRAPDSHGAMLTLLRGQYGQVLLAIIALGLAGYAVWRVIEGITDPERHGRSAKGIALRLRSIVTGGIHAALAVSAAKLAVGEPDDRGGSREAEQWTAKALATPGGKLVIAIVAGGFIIYGLYQLHCAYKAKLSDKLSLGSMGSTMRRAVIAISRAGIAARGIVFGMIGVLFMRAAYYENPKQAGSVSKSLRELTDLGTWPFVAIAIGLVAYGVYQLINARYRRIRVG